MAVAISCGTREAAGDLFRVREPMVYLAANHNTPNPGLKPGRPHLRWEDGHHGLSRVTLRIGTMVKGHLVTEILPTCLQWSVWAHHCDQGPHQHWSLIGSVCSLCPFYLDATFLAAGVRDHLDALISTLNVNMIDTQMSCRWCHLHQADTWTSHRWPIDVSVT